jgi:hypothetical protein
LSIIPDKEGAEWPTAEEGIDKDDHVGRLPNVGALEIRDEQRCRLGAGTSVLEQLTQGFETMPIEKR